MHHLGTDVAIESTGSGRTSALGCWSLHKGMSFFLKI